MSEWEGMRRGMITVLRADQLTSMDKLGEGRSPVPCACPLTGAMQWIQWTGPVVYCLSVSRDMDAERATGVEVSRGEAI